ncbi:MAG: hypothetical protein JWM53_5178 [bacterium]|jgi:hypothetical protein|nr:hypothetical protein [bacterium]
MLVQPIGWSAGQAVLVAGPIDPQMKQIEYRSARASGRPGARESGWIGGRTFRGIFPLVAVSGCSHRLAEAPLTLAAVGWVTTVVTTAPMVLASRLAQADCTALFWAPVGLAIGAEQ